MYQKPSNWKSNSIERAAFQWLHDCDIRPWMLDLVTGQVYTEKRKYNSVVRFAKHIGWNPNKHELRKIKNGR